MADQRIRPHGRDRDRDRDLTDDPERYPRDRDNRGSAGRRRGDYDGKRRERERSRSRERWDRDRRDRDRDRDRAHRDRDRAYRARGRESSLNRERQTARGRLPQSRSKSPSHSRSQSPILSRRGRDIPHGAKPSLSSPFSGRKTRDSDVNDVMQIDPTTTAGSDADADNVDDLIRKTMGFSSFKSTQNTKVPGNNVYGVRKEKKTQYRQYMNRVGGFNRPLSPTR